MNSHQQHGSIPFWELFQVFDPARAPGQGVDHQDAGPGFPFGGPSGSHQSPPRPHRGDAGSHHPGPWAGGPEWGSWQHHHGHGHRGGRRHGFRGDHSHGRAGPHDDAQARNADADAAAQDTGVTPARDNEKASVSASDDTVHDNAEVPDPAEVTPGEEEDEDMYAPPPSCGPNRHGGCARGRGRCRRGGPRRGCRAPHHGGAAPFAWPGVMHGIVNHPFFQGLRDQAERYAGHQPFPGFDTAGTRGADADADASSFSPPVDVYNTSDAYVVHVALPGARKEDVGVDWDPDTARLRVAGVVHRPGDERLLEALVSAERRVGLFERHVPLPPAGVAERDPVDGSHITAKMDDGVLVIVVPKLEKEWTEIRRVDIE